MLEKRGVVILKLEFEDMKLESSEAGDESGLGRSYCLPLATRGEGRPSSNNAVPLSSPPTNHPQATSIPDPDPSSHPAHSFHQRPGQKLPVSLGA